MIKLWNDQDIESLGMGCWAIGGPFYSDTQPLGWGEVDDNESIKAIEAAWEAGIRFFDTADVYGAGHSEKIVGKALKGKQDAIIATKFGNVFDEKSKQVSAVDYSENHIRKAIDASRRRLDIDVISLYQLHVEIVDDDANKIYDVLNQLVEDGLIEAFGWSTDYLSQASKWPLGKNFKAIQHCHNLFKSAPKELLDYCSDNNLVSINRSPLAMGALTSRLDKMKKVVGDDIRAHPPEWLPYFEGGHPLPSLIKTVEAVRELLTQNGRSLAQGSLAWIWASNPNTIPIPGFRTVKQVNENVKALEFGPLSQETKTEIDNLISSLN